MLCMIDNYDSFTYNLVSYLAQLNAEPIVIKNDQIGVPELERMLIRKFIISPGPCTPDESGISMDVIKSFGVSKPILGICLGHEAIGQAYGAKVIHAREVMHGKKSKVHHDGKGVFKGVKNPVEVARYHSLVLDKESIPPELEVSAWTENEKGEVDEVMGVRHRTHKVEGIQFHPESILTEYGHLMLSNYIRADY